MKHLIPGTTTQGPTELFTGDVYFDVIARGESPSRLRVNTVRFAPGARTAWHSHGLRQTLHVTDGIGVVATRDQVIIMRPETRCIPHRVRSTGTALCPRTS